MYKHRCLENIKKLYKTGGKYDDQHQYKDILEAEMVSTPEVCNDNIPMTPNKSEYTRNPSTRKPLRQLSETLDVDHKTTICRLGAFK